MTPFESYKTFLAVKSHFTTSYDYIKYNGKVNATQSSFEVRKDKYQYYKLSKQKENALDLDTLNDANINFVVTGIKAVFQPREIKRTYSAQDEDLKSKRSSVADDSQNLSEEDEE